MKVSMRFGLVACALVLFCATTSAFGADSNIASRQIAVTEYAGEGVAEFFLTPDLPSDWMLTPSPFHPLGDIVTVPVGGDFQVYDGTGGLDIVDGFMFAPGPGMTLRIHDTDIPIEHVRVGFDANGAGTVLFGSESAGPGWGHPFLVLDGTTVDVLGHGAVAIDAVLRLDSRFASGMGVPEYANAFVGTMRIGAEQLRAVDILIDAPDVGNGGGHGDTSDTTGCPAAGPCGTSPDLFCNKLGSGFSKNGTLSNIDAYNDGNLVTVTAYSFETWSCNQGDEWHIWFDQNANHPLVSQNVYRVKDGRFDQIGMSWLKHTWCAADFSNCAPGGSGNGTCDWMTIGIDDAYSASLNGVQPDLGPRSDVNAADGQYPYPYTIHFNGSGNSIFKRLQIRNDDLNPSLNVGAKYIAEGYYTSTVEANKGFNKQYNNAVSRKVNVGSFTGGGYNLGFTGANLVHKTGVEGWVQLANDPAETGYYDPDDWKPTLRTLFATEDGAPLGKIQMAYNVTDLGGGMWAYDYHIYNYNSHRSVRSVSIPLPADAAGVSMDFHAPFYHSDEPVDNVAWSMANTPGGTAEWFTDVWTVGNDKTANALRWSTGYSFHLETTSPPENKIVALGLFRPGPGSDTLQTSVMGPGADCNGNNVADGIDISQGGFADDVPPGGDGIPDVCQEEILFGELVATSATSMDYQINGASAGQLSVRINGMSAENSCVSSWLALDGSISPTPVEATLAAWQAAEPIIVSGAEIIPERDYEFTVFVDGVIEPVSAAQATTLVWGDVDANGSVSLGDAFSAVLDFQNGTVTASADIEPCGGNGLINLADVQRIVLVFTGVWNPYPYGTQCTMPCP